MMARMTQAVQGYAEGYYGRLLSWQERRQLLEVLSRNAQNTYYYAPKEDAKHRLHWREPYDSDWREGFRDFCAAASALNITVVAGVAPGLDFDFKDLHGGPDLQALLDKCRQLLADGAHRLSLLMDDIDEDFHERSGGMSSEGRAHALLANTLAEALAVALDEKAAEPLTGSLALTPGEGLWVTPRIYANELAGSAPDYLPDFLSTLDESHTVLYCGSDIVARQADYQVIRALAPASAHRLVLWDNLYANDYCPQRLFAGPWLGREGSPNCLLNPTGMLQTDCLLLDLMAGTQQPGTHATTVWREVLTRHGVPEAFFALAPYVEYPVFNREAFMALPPPSPEVYAALETCLWRWKTPLSREWYPFLFNLKLDLLIQEKRMSVLRIRKTQSAPRAEQLGVGDPT